MTERQPLATTPDFDTFAPHLGHASALVLSSFPHSLHLVIAIENLSKVLASEKYREIALVAA
jgi:hypothetical protein